VIPPRNGDVWEYRGRRQRRALPQVSVIEAKRSTGRYRLLHTYAYGRFSRRRTWIKGVTLGREYRLVHRQEELQT
jgi:hypothetical protein